MAGPVGGACGEGGEGARGVRTQGVSAAACKAAGLALPRGCLLVYVLADLASGQDWVDRLAGAGWRESKCERGWAGRWPLALPSQRTGIAAPLRAAPAIAPHAAPMERVSWRARIGRAQAQQLLRWRQVSRAPIGPIILFPPPPRRGVSLRAVLCPWIPPRTHAALSLSPLSLSFQQILAASWVEDEVQRQALTPFCPPEAVALKGSPEAEGAAAAVAAAVAAISRFRGPTVSASQVVARAAGGLARERGRIFAILAAAPRPGLNHILARTNLAALVEVAGARTVELLATTARKEGGDAAGGDASTGGRLDDLNVLSRAALVDALQKVGLRHRPRRQRWVVSVIKHTKGADLTRLKSLLDDGGDHHSFFRLATVDLQGPAQAAVLAHVAAEGSALLASFRAAHPAGPPGVTLKVVSDIDDTLVCSGGHYPAGVDRRLPRGCAYPGACAFFNELDAGHAGRVLECTAAASGGGGTGGGGSGTPGGRSPRLSTPGLGAATDDERATRAAAARIRGAVLGPWRPDFLESARHRVTQAAAITGSGTGSVGTSASAGGGGNLAPGGLSAAFNPAPPSSSSAPPIPHQRGGHLVFLSARPETYKGYTEASSYRSIFRPLVRSRDLHSWPVLLLGSLRAGPAALAGWVSRSSTRAAARGVAGTLTNSLYVALARKKLERFEAFAALYPEAAWVFVGDNGQGDVLVAESLYRRARAPAKSGGPPPLPLAACFINRAVPVLATLSALRHRQANKPAWLAEWRGEGIHVHKTHVGMAVQAHTLGLMDAAGLRRVALEAAWGFASSRAAHAFAVGVDWSRVARQLNADIRAANQFLPSDAQVGPIRAGGDDGSLTGFARAGTPGGGGIGSVGPPLRGGSPSRAIPGAGDGRASGTGGGSARGSLRGATPPRPPPKPLLGGGADSGGAGGEAAAATTTPPSPSPTPTGWSPPVRSGLESGASPPQAPPPPPSQSPPPLPQVEEAAAGGGGVPPTALGGGAGEAAAAAPPRGVPIPPPVEFWIGGPGAGSGRGRSLAARSPSPS